MELRAELKYSKSHEWIKEDGDVSSDRINRLCTAELGDFVFINLPEVGDEVTVGAAFADVESVKAVSDVFSPVSGVVTEINEELLDAPESINETPYDAWFVKVGEVKETEELLDADAYKAFVESEEA